MKLKTLRPISMLALAALLFASFVPAAVLAAPPAPRELPGPEGLDRKGAGPMDEEYLTIVGTALAINAETGEFSTLIAALVAAGLVETLDGRGQFTVFAPTDAAFAELGFDADNIGDLPVEDLTAILLYHVAQGRRDSGSVLSADRVRMMSKEFAFPSIMDSKPYINDAEIIIPDVMASNGIIHVINKVLMPPAGNSIVDIALAVNAETGEFSTLIAALQSADLVEALDSRGQFTVFAPTDAGFLNAGLTPDNIGDVPVEALTDILLYHVANGRRMSGDVLTSDQIRMLNGDFIFIDAANLKIIDGDPSSPDAMLLAPDLIDIEASNGVIHVIDNVLFPPAE